VTPDGVPVGIAEGPNIRRWAPAAEVAAWLRLAPGSTEAVEAFRQLQLVTRRLHRDATDVWLAEQGMTRIEAGRAGLLKHVGVPYWDDELRGRANGSR
jgi:hypothetical protein